MKMLKKIIATAMIGASTIGFTASEASALSPLTTANAKAMTKDVGERFVYKVIPTSVRITSRYRAVVWFDQWNTEKGWKWDISSGDDTYTIAGRAFIRPHSKNRYWVESSAWD
jgi:hypothetical protein